MLLARLPPQKEVCSCKLNYAGVELKWASACTASGLCVYSYPAHSASACVCCGVSFLWSVGACSVVVVLVHKHCLPVLRIFFEYAASCPVTETVSALDSGCQQLVCARCCSAGQMALMLWLDTICLVGNIVNHDHVCCRARVELGTLKNGC